MMKKRGAFHLRSALFPMLYYAANSVHQGYMSLFYTRLGFSGVQLGTVNAATAAAAMAAQPVWGMLGDRAKRQKLLLAMLALFSALTLPLALAGDALAVQLGAAVLFYAFFCALLPLGDAILLQAERDRFGAYRLAGGASFALAGALFGAVRGRAGADGEIWATAALIVLAGASALLLPGTSGRQERKKVSVFALLKDKRLARMLLFLMPLQATMGCFYTFYAPHFKSLEGGSDALLGLGYLLSAASEAPYLLLSGRIYRRFGAQKPMCIAAGVLAARWLLLGTAQSATAALISQALHGGGFIVITVSMAYWISENVPRELRTSGQMLLNMLSFGAARLLGNLGGGLLAGTLGMAGVFIAGAGVCIAGLIIFAPGLLRNRD